MQGFNRLLICCALFLVICSAFTWAQPDPHVQAQVGAAPRITQYTLPPDKLAKAKALYTTQNVLLVIETIYGFIVLLALLKLGVGPRLRNWAQQRSSFSFVQGLIFFPLVLLTIALTNLPFSIYRHRVYISYGISVQGWGSWFWDWTKAQLIQCLVLALVLWLLYRIIHKSPRRWWFYFWLVSIPIVVFVTFVSPVILEPMFNRFEPLAKTNPALVQSLQELTKKAGLEISPERMFEMKASEKVTDYNAYVSGIGSTKRVVVWDTTEHDMTTDQILFIFGHEMGHYVLNHIWKGIGFLCTLLFFAFALGFRVVQWSVRKWSAQLGVTGVDDLASFPLILLIASCLAFVLTPVGSTFSRHIEHQADIYGLEVIHGQVPHTNQVAAVTFQKLGEKSFVYPYPNRLLVFWIYDHPAIPDRLLFALQYHPWAEGRATKYVP